MLQKRVIVCLDVRAGQVTKGVRFRDNGTLATRWRLPERYYAEGADELVFYDITASAEDRGIIIEVVERVAERIFIPFSVGGGIASVDDMRRVLLAGARRSASTAKRSSSRRSSTPARRASVAKRSS